MMSPLENQLQGPPLTLGACATLACSWEATAPKPGNVYRGADFADLSYADFLTSAAAIGPIIEQTASRGVGATVLAGVEATRGAIGAKNTNLGILLLIAPLAAARVDRPLCESIAEVLELLTVDDCCNAYAAVRLVQPGGLGRVDEADVNDGPPTITMQEAMRLAAGRDLVARQYANNFADVFAVADRLETHAATLPLGDAIVLAYLELLRDEPDSLISRKCGLKCAQDTSEGARQVLEARTAGDDVFKATLADFDFWLRSDGNRLNPGTTADVVTAALFVLLAERRLRWPISFYAPSEC